ncbi:MAG: YceI-like family protein [Candidatus Eremiobacteraeota bacterium]|nr:YceI-like family protein [Candidatus Eremiobacteraeota bacterium]
MLRFSALQVCAPAAAFGGSFRPAFADVVWSGDGTRSSVTLTVSHLLLAKITGTIPIPAATIVTADGEMLPFLVDAMLDAAALRTGDPQRDAQLRSDRFFDVARFPAITFASERVVATGPLAFQIQGELTMRGVTRPLVLDGRLARLTREPNGGRRARYEATGRFKRSAYGMVYARGIAGDEVRLDVIVEAVDLVAER